MGEARWGRRAHAGGAHTVRQAEDRCRPAVRGSPWRARPLHARVAQAVLSAGAAAHLSPASACPNSWSGMFASARKAQVSSCFWRRSRPGELYTSPYRCSLRGGRVWDGMGRRDRLRFDRSRCLGLCGSSARRPLRSLPTPAHSPDPLLQHRVGGLHVGPHPVRHAAIHQLKGVAGRAVHLHVQGAQARGAALGSRRRRGAARRMRPPLQCALTMHTRLVCIAALPPCRACPQAAAWLC